MKHNSTIISLTAASFFALAASANATDIFDARNDALADPAPQAVNWSGLWVGALGGMNFFNSELDYFKHKGDDNETHANIDGLGSEGLFGEAQIGYDHQISNRFVVGIFGGVNLSDAEFNASLSHAGETQGSIATDYEWGSVLGARLGVLKSPDTMFYVGGGWAHAQIGDTVVSDGEDAINISGPEVDGWFGEIGMETRVRDLGDNVFMTVAGRYTDYGTETLWSNDNAYCPEEIEIDTDSLAVMVGLKAKFGGF